MKEAPNTQFEAAIAGASASGLRVLLAEDTPINAEAMRAMAAHLSVEMDVVSNGLDAIEMIEAAAAKDRPYSLLLVDVMMPILDGIETTKRLRERGFAARQLPIVAVTAATSFDEIRTYKACGMQAFIAKPVALADLRATFDAWGHESQSKRGKRSSRIEPALMDALTQQFRDRNKRTFVLIEDALASKTINPDAVEEIRHLLHQIAGTASTFGDAKLSEAAKALETSLIEAEARDDDVRPILEEAATILKKRIK